MALLLDRLTNKIGSFLGTNTTLPGPKSGGFSIQEFSSKVGEVDGILSTNLFLVTINSPSLDTRTLSFFTMSTQLPGLDIALDENIRLGIGPVERFPHSAVFSDLDLVFIGDGRGYVMNAMHLWLDAIVEHQPGDSGSTGSNYFRVGYRDDYTSTIEIVVFNATTDKILVYKFFNAFPYKLYPVSMSWANKADMMLIGTRFFYTAWSSLLYDPAEAEAQGLSFLQKLQKAGTIAQVVMSMKKPQSIGDAINLVNNANILQSGLSGFF